MGLECVKELCAQQNENSILNYHGGIEGYILKLAMSKARFNLYACLFLLRVPQEFLQEFLSKWVSCVSESQTYHLPPSRYNALVNEGLQC